MGIYIVDDTRYLDFYRIINSNNGVAYVLDEEGKFYEYHFDKGLDKYKKQMGIEEL